MSSLFDRVANDVEAPPQPRERVVPIRVDGPVAMPDGDRFWVGWIGHNGSASSGFRLTEAELRLFYARIGELLR